MAIDIFGGAAQAAPAPEEAQQQTPPSDPWQSTPAPAPVPTVVQGSGGEVVLTFKGGRDFDAPWIVIHAANLDEALSYVTEGGEKLADLFARVKAASGLFNGGGSAPSQNSSPRSAPAADPAGPPPGAPASPGPGWVHKNGTKNGRTWQGWFPPYAQKDSVKPQFYDL